MSYQVRISPTGQKFADPVFRDSEDRIARLQCEADRGARWAQTELGRRYENGDGVAQSDARAAVLFSLAASTAPTTTQVYAPPVTLGGRGQVLILPNPNASSGDPEAQYRLGRMYIDGRGVPQSVARGEKLLAQAAAQGFNPE